MVISPDDYRRQAGFKRSVASRIGRIGSPPLSGPITAYQTYDLSDPALVEMMRGGRIGVAGVAVNEKQAFRNSTFFRAMSLIAGSLGMLPIHLMRRKADGTTEKAKDHPLFNVLHRKANSYQTAGQFRSHMQLAALLDGNAFALKIRSRGAVRQIVPLPRGRVTPKLSESWQLTFEYDRMNGGKVTLPASDVFHFRAPVSLDGLNGIKLLDVAADTLGLALTAQQAAARLLTKGSMARGALETEQTLGDEAIEHLKASLRDDYSGANASDDWMILEEGLKAKLFASSARDSQLRELMQGEAEEVSRFSGVPRPLLMFDETSWGSGIEQLGLFFVTYCLMPWFVIWEEAIWMCLLSETEQDTMYAKVNEGALLRGSLKDQAEFFKAALGPNTGYLSQNEVREAFDRNPRPEGDDLPRAGTTAAAVQQEDIEDAA
ncbi:phage portal protein [Novosphingopyxis sp. YJ-S2-01]|uniref:phage portal protein n=1 Tax=Novosphingopyxis sp. YJ-S2-01 TaxID=2794021 RepID=UPI0018DC0BD6|nr:phage portal protein [Novosphingopyxis sp. YJ-S2-01]